MANQVKKKSVRKTAAKPKPQAKEIDPQIKSRLTTIQAEMEALENEREFLLTQTKQSESYYRKRYEELAERFKQAVRNLESGTMKVELTIECTHEADRYDSFIKNPRISVVGWRVLESMPYIDSHSLREAIEYIIADDPYSLMVDNAPIPESLSSLYQELDMLEKEVKSVGLDWYEISDS